VPKIRVPTSDERAIEWLSLNPCPPDEPGAECINVWIYRAACAFSTRLISEESAFDVIQRNITRNLKHPREISRAIQKAYSTDFHGDGQSHVKYPPYNPILALERASVVHETIDNEKLAKLSPRPLNARPGSFLDSVFQPGEFIFTSTGTDGSGIEIYHEVGNPKTSRAIERVIRKNINGAWYVINPFDSPDQRTDENLSCIRHMLLESDVAPKDVWLKIVVQLHVPVIALYESGNRSVHCLIRIDAEDREHFQILREKFINELVPLGACPGSFTASRLSRLPNVVRNDNFRVQKLLYLNPTAEAGKPIWKKIK